MKLFVIGKPIKHSLSPLIHNCWIKKYNIDVKYEKKEIDLLHLEKIISEIRHEKIKGVNVTLPYKKIITRFIDEMSQTAKDSEAVNTVFFKENKIYGDNTDGKGFIESIEKEMRFDFEKKKIFIIGAGGAAYGILSQLNKKKVGPVFVANRTKEKLDNLVNHFKSKKSDIFQSDWSALKPPDDTDIIINTTSFGMIKGELIEINSKGLTNSTIFADIIYKPKETEFLKFARLQGFKTINGLDMLIRQAAISFNLWFGISLTEQDIKNAKDICDKAC